MKYFFVTLCTMLCLFFMLPITAFASQSDVEWVRITESNVKLYANCENSKVMFELQKSYYLQVLGEENGMYFVSVMQNEEDFPQITGYVWKAEVTDCDKAPIAPYYPTEKIVVNSDCAQLKLSPVPSAEIVITATNTQKLSFYGEITSYNQTWFYVYFGGRFGYVTADCVTTPVISLHPTPLQEEVAVTITPSQDTETEAPTTNNTSEIFLILFVVILAVAICLALFLPGNVKKNEVFDKDI